MAGTVAARWLALAPVHPGATDGRCQVHLNIGEALILGRRSEAPLGQQLESGIQNMLVHRKHVHIEGAPPRLTALGAHPCVVINSTGCLRLTRGQSCTLSALDEIHLVDVDLAQRGNLASGATGYTGGACAYRVDCAAPLLLNPIAPDGRAYRSRPRLQLDTTTTTQLLLGRTAGPWGVTDPRVSRLHARICAGPGPPSVTAVGMHPCVLIKALTGAQQRP